MSKFAKDGSGVIWSSARDPSSREGIGKCAVDGCDNDYDPRWFVHIGGAAYQSCDGHGCAPGEWCRECTAKGLS